MALSSWTVTEYWEARARLETEAEMITIVTRHQIYVPVHHVGDLAASLGGRGQMVDTLHCVNPDGL